MEGAASLEVLIVERRRLVSRLEDERAQLRSLESLVENLSSRIAADERMLLEIDSVLGRAPQLRLEEADVRLRGARLEEVAIELLEQEWGSGAEVHYRQWFELVRSRGHEIAGKEPLNTFLSQINRSSAVESVGRRSGRYRLSHRAA